MTQVINLLDPISDNRNEDMTEAVFYALQKCRAGKSSILNIPKETYHFYPDRAFEKFYFMSNNDPGLKSVGFPIIDLDNLVIDANGSEFIFHGRMTPFILDGVRNITVKNLSIDFDRPFFSQGEIVDSGPNFKDIRICHNQYPYRIEGDEIKFFSGLWESERIMLFLEVEPGSGMPAYHTGDEYIHNQVIRVEELGHDIIRFKGSFLKTHTKGNVMIIKHEPRLNPAIFITNSTDVTFENVTVYQASGMAFIAEMSHNIVIRKSRVVAKETEGRLAATNADATHFVNCTGDILHGKIMNIHPTGKSLLRFYKNTLAV